VDCDWLPEETLKMPVELPVKTVLFWRVLDDLDARHNLRYEPDGAPRGLRVKTARREDDRPVESAPCYAGAFRVSALPVERVRRGFVREIGQNPRAREDLARVTL